MRKKVGITNPVVWIVATQLSELPYGPDMKFVDVKHTPFCVMGHGPVTVHNGFGGAVHAPHDAWQTSATVLKPAGGTYAVPLVTAAFHVDASEDRVIAQT